MSSIYSDGKSRILRGNFPKRFRLKNGDQEVPYIRTGADSVRLSGDLPIGDLLVEEIIREKTAQPAKLDAQSLAIINKQDFDRIDILNKKLAINQEKMNDQLNSLAEHEATLANLETKNANDIDLLNEQTGAAVQLLKGAIEDTEKKNVAVQKALSQVIKETGEDLSDSLVAHETAKNPHRITKATIGLEKVEDISPDDMPVSKAVKKELDKKADKKSLDALDEKVKKATKENKDLKKGVERLVGGIGGLELPFGGEKGQVLAKASDKSGDYEWSSTAAGVTIHNDLEDRDVSDCHPISAITGLQSALNAKYDASNPSNYQTGTQVANSIATETTNRENADNGLQSQIDAITASSDVKDIVGTYAQLQAYDTSTLGNNDIIKVLQDETHSDETTYYRWSTTTETFTLIGEEGPYYTKSEANSTFVPQTRTVNGKALSADITLTYTDVGAINGIDSLMVTTALGYTPVNPSSLASVATSGLYSDLTGTPSLATVATSGSYNDLTDKPTIPTSADYWTTNTDQTTTGKKLIKYKATYSVSGDDQQNGFRVLGDESASTGGYTASGYWMGRMMVGTNKRTFLLGVTKNTTTNTYMCGIGAHSWTDAEAQTGAAWEDVYIQPDGNKAVYLGGKQWRVDSGWFKVQNDGNATAAYRSFINTGTNTSPTWRTILPNQATGSNSVLIKPSISATFSYTYGTSINGTVTANYGSSFGYNSSAGSYATALGYNATASGQYAIQIGYGTNSTANTMSVGLSNSLNVQLLDSSGEIPDARIKTTIARTSQIPTVNDSTITIQKNGTDVDSFTTNASSNKSINITVPTTAADVSALPASTKYGADLSYSSNTLQLKDQDGNDLGNPVTISGGGGNTNNLLDFKWVDHELNDQSWLKADTFSWQDGTVYSDAYDHLVDDIDGKTATSETIGSYTISYYLADDGHKITTDETTVSNIYAESGVAWYYVLDQANTRFKLPRTKYGFNGYRDAVGNYIAAGLPNITGNVNSNHGYMTGSDGACSISNSIGDWNGGGSVKRNSNWQFNAHNSNAIYGNSTTVQPPATQMYLYFYVGQFTQSATEQTAGLNASLFNGKVDLDGSNATFPHIVETYQSGANWYRLYSDGWIEQGGSFVPSGSAATTYNVIYLKPFSSTNYFVVSNYAAQSTNQYGQCYSLTTTQCTIKCYGGNKNNWFACGY